MHWNIICMLCNNLSNITLNGVGGQKVIALEKLFGIEEKISKIGSYEGTFSGGFLIVYLC